MGVTFKMASYRIIPAVRHFSTSAARSSKMVQAPIQLFGLEGRYAHALYSAASKEKKLDAVEAELKKFQGVFAKDANLREFMANPSVQKVEKKTVLDKVMTQSKASPVTANFFGAMAENGRLPKMNAIIGAFEKLMAAHRGEIICSVTTAKELDAKNKKDLTAAREAFLKKGETLKPNLDVDPSIIGGMIVNIGDRYVDMSMASKIKAYSALIKQEV